MIGNVLGVAAPPGLRILAVGNDIEVAPLLSRQAVDIRPPPWIRWNGFLQVGPRPLRLVGGPRNQRLESLLRRWIAPGVEAVMVEGAFEGAYLRLRGLDLGLADLTEVFGRHVAREQAEYHHNDQQLEQSEAGSAARSPSDEDTELESQRNLLRNFAVLRRNARWG